MKNEPLPSSPSAANSNCINSGTFKQIDFYLAALILSALFQVMHILALPLLITCDGSHYVEMSRMLTTTRFFPEWDFLRGPLYPGAIKVFFRLMGEHPMTMVGMHALAGFCGIWMLGAAIRREGFPRLAAAVILLLSAYPILITYQHTLLSDIGTFCCLSAMVNVMLWRPKVLWHKTAAVVLVMTSSYYFKPDLIYVAPAAGIMYLLQMADSGTSSGWRFLIKGISKRALMHATIAVVIPFVLALPWSYLASKQDPAALERPQMTVHPGDPLAGGDSENELFLKCVTPAERNMPNSILPCPPALDALTRERFSQRTGSSLVSILVRRLNPVFSVLVFLGCIFTLAGLIVGAARADPRLLAVTCIPAAFIAMHALALPAFDRYAFPAYTLALANLLVVPMLLFGEYAGAAPAHVEEDTEFNASAPRMLACFVFLAAGIHIIYLLLSTTVPSADDAHYMTGARSVALGIRSGTAAGIWKGYINALGFKAPLVCVPAAVFMLVGGINAMSCLMSLVMTFVLIAAAGYSFFRKALSRSQAALAALVLVTMPMLTSLTHRFYVESMLLLISLVFLDILIRHPWDSWVWSILGGVVLGFGILCKVSFPAFLFVPSIYLLAIEIRRLAQSQATPLSWINLIGRLSVMISVGFAVAWTWYAYNLRDTLNHAALAANSEECSYPAVPFFLSIISTGPHLIVFLIAVASMPYWVRLFLSGTFTLQQRRGWMAILLLAGGTLFHFGNGDRKIDTLYGHVASRDCGACRTCASCLGKAWKARACYFSGLGRRLLHAVSQRLFWMGARASEAGRFARRRLQLSDQCAGLVRRLRALGAAAFCHR